MARTVIITPTGMPVSANGNSNDFDVSQFSRITMYTLTGASSYNCNLQFSYKDAPGAGDWTSAWSDNGANTGQVPGSTAITWKISARRARFVISNWVSGNPAVDSIGAVGTVSESTP